MSVTIVEQNFRQYLSQNNTDAVIIAKYDLDKIVFPKNKDEILIEETENGQPQQVVVCIPKNPSKDMLSEGLRGCYIAAFQKAYEFGFNKISTRILYSDDLKINIWKSYNAITDAASTVCNDLDLPIDIVITVDLLSSDRLSKFAKKLVSVTGKEEHNIKGRKNNHSNGESGYPFNLAMVVTESVLVTNGVGLKETFDIPDELIKELKDPKVDWSSANYYVEGDFDRETAPKLLYKHMKNNFLNANKVKKKLFGIVKKTTTENYLDPAYASRPTKTPLIYICLALRLYFDESKEVLSTAGYSLDLNDARDKIYYYALKDRIDPYTLVQWVRYTGCLEAEQHSPGMDLQEM